VTVLAPTATATSTGLAPAITAVKPWVSIDAPIAEAAAAGKAPPRSPSRTRFPSGWT
jgi:hypothetical protein